jgi:hypothetical protein
MTVIDLKSKLYYGHSNYLKEGVAYEFGQIRLFSNYEISAFARTSKMYQSISRRLQNKTFHLSGSISLNGFCPANF